MKCIMVRLDGNTFIDVSHDWYVHAASAFSRTVIIDIIGKMLCTKIEDGENPIEVFNEFILSQIGYVIDRRNAGKDDFDKDEIYSDNEKDLILQYFVSCYKMNLPYIPDVGVLKFMACVWHEDLEFSKASVCLVAEHKAYDNGLSTVEPGSDLREPCDGDGVDRRYLSAVFK